MGYDNTGRRGKMSAYFKWSAHPPHHIPLQNLCSAWLSVHWWHQNHRRTCGLFIQNRVIIQECKTILSAPECLCLFRHRSPGCVTVVWYSVCVTLTLDWQILYVNLSPFTSGNSISLADLTSLWFVIHVVDPRDLKLDRPMWEELTHLIKVILTNLNLRI